MSVSSEVIKVGAGFAGLSAVAAAARHVYIEVPERHAALRTHSDRAIRRRDTWFTGKKAGGTYGKVGAGYHATLGLRDYQIISLKDRVDALQVFKIDRGETPHWAQRVVQSEVTWGVIDAPEDTDGELLYKALYGANGEEALRTAVVNICGDGIRKVMLGLEKPEFAISDEVQPLLEVVCQEELECTYGVELRRLFIKESATSLESAVGNVGLNLGDFGLSNGNGNGHKEYGVPDIGALR